MHTHTHIEIEFEIRILDIAQAEGYLFLCSSEEFRVGPDSFCFPHVPAYWALDPSGAEGLGTEGAKSLGFPAIQLRTVIIGRFWGAKFHDTLRRLHEGKGFNPESPDVVRLEWTRE